ncbi:MAG TPA: thioredoxin domain-containing protein [Hyphomonadaceae bacterium]|jgi:protein-disulfide isomerase|nr:thioredoxin domain-containing protein [Hyphomonadaceae bacterium]
MMSAARPLAALVAGAAALFAASCDQQGSASSGPAAAVNPVLTDVVMGQATAPVEIIEYASFTCPHCRDFYKQDFPRLKANYIDTGKVKYIYRDFPTDAQLAVMLISVSRCKGASVYYDVVDDIFSHQIELYEAASQGKAGPMLVEMGQRHGIAEPELRTCLTHKGINDALNKTIADGRAKGVEDTPTVFVNGVKQANHSYEALSAQIEKALKGETLTASPAAAPEGTTSPATGGPVAPATPQPAPTN